LKMKFLVVFACLIAVSIACKCALPTQEQVWQRSDVVAKMRIESKEKSANQVKYTANYLDTFKPAGQFHIQIAVPIFTSSSSASCGVTELQIGQEYLITATRDGQNLKINTCNGMPDSANGSSSPLGALHWNKVNTNLLNKLKSGKF